MKRRLIVPREYKYFDHQHNEKSVTFNYTLYFEGDKLVEVRNEYGYPCRKESDVWDYFSKQQF